MNRSLFLGRSWRGFAAEAALVAGVSFLGLWQAGLFVIGTDSFVAGGYGHYRLNLLAPFDPGAPHDTHYGHNAPLIWSRVLPDIPQGRGDYEGFSYLGLGALVALAAALPTVLRRPGLLRVPRRLTMLPAVFLALLAFAVTHRVGVGGREFGLELPPFLIAAANMFRASGRLVWPVLYAALLWVTWLLVRGYGARPAAWLLALALTVQVLDTAPGWGARRDSLAWNWEDWEPAFYADFWKAVPERYRKIRLLPPRNHHCHWAAFAQLAAANRLATNAIYTARIDANRLAAARAAAFSRLAFGRYASDTLYVLDERHLVVAAASLRGEDLLAEVDGFHLIAPGWRACGDCPEAGTPLELEALLPRIRPNETLGFAADGRGPGFLGRGWSWPEPWGVWSDGRVAELFLPLPEGGTEGLSLEIDATALTAPAHPLQQVRVHQNGTLLGTLVFTEGEAHGPRRLALAAHAPEPGRAALLRLRFDIASPVRPIDLGLGADARELGIGLRQLRVTGPR